MIMPNLDDKNKKIVIFLHIPKAAGSTLRRIIEKEYQRDSILSLNSSSLSDCANEIGNLTEVQIKELKFIQGHIEYGLHKYLPRSCTYITMLRNPAQRVISHYYYVLRTPNHYLHETVTANKMSLEDYIRSQITTELNNGQTRLLSGANKVHAGLCSSEDLQAAKKHLEENFAVVGLSEKFDESLLLLKQALNWRTPFYRSENITKNKQTTKNDLSSLLKMIKEYNELDFELYRFAQERFETELAKISLPDRLKFLGFKNLNKIYSYLYSSAKQISISHWKNF